ncbi:Vps5 C terminal like-domain-containing protein [Phakopsora pachyrhizi]|nr:Vps5 C terminal like-domain-containing protein [Phakopsora pachyrhizi]
MSNEGFIINPGQINSDSFTSFGGLDDGVGLDTTHNPFADLRSSASANMNDDEQLVSSSSTIKTTRELQPSVLSPQLNNDTSSIDTFKASELDVDTSNYFNQHQVPALTNTTAITAQEDELHLSNGPEVIQDVGFDGRPLDISPEHFLSFSSNNDDSFFTTQENDQLQTPHGFSFSTAQDHFADRSEPNSFIQPPSSSGSAFPSTEIHRSDKSTPIKPSATGSNHQRTSKPSASKSPTFKPFGVSATLTSSNDDEDNDDDDIDDFNSASNISSTLNSRPALPDILGGVSIGASVLLPDSRSSLPAFKKSPKKSKRETSSSISISNGVEDSKFTTRSTTQKPGNVLKPYRPLGLKIAKAQPIITSPPPEPSTNSNQSQNSLLNRQVSLAQKPILPSPPGLVSNSGSIPSSGQAAVAVDPDVTSCSQSSEPSFGNQNDRSISQSVKDLKGPIIESSPSTSSSAEGGVPKDRVVVSPISSATSEHQSSAQPLLDSSKNQSSSEAKIPASVSDPSTTNHTVASASTRPDFLKKEEVGESQAITQQTTITSHPSAPKIITSPSLTPAFRSSNRSQSESEDEDDRPLASVREGLVQQQNLAYKDPPTGLTPTPSSSTFSNKLSPHIDTPIQPPMPRYRCSVGDPQKMGMINDIHTVYTVKTTATDPGTYGSLKGSSTVLRRFRDFVWLFEVLTSNNPGVIVPPIPDKNIRNRFQEGFIAARRVALEIFLQKTVNHPMLMSDPDLKLFLESDSFALEVKHRRPDSFNQHGWLAQIAGPRFSETDEFFDQRKMALESLEGQLKGLQSSLSAASKARRVLSQSLSDLSQALLTLSTCDLSKPVRNALDRLAGLHRQFHTWSEEQSKDELEGLLATVEAYSRLINSVRLTFSGRVKSWEKWQLSLNNLRKVQMNHEKVKRSAVNEHSSGLVYSLAELEGAERRAHEAHSEFGDVSKLIKAEMQRFDREKVEDFKAAICGYVDGLTKRQRQVVRFWQEYYQLLQALSKSNNNSEANSNETQKNVKQASQGQEQSTGASGSSVDDKPKKDEFGKGREVEESVPSNLTEETSAWASSSDEPLNKEENSLPTLAL